jgi:hypothetical protein
VFTPVVTTTFKRFEPKKGYVAPYIRLPWGYKRRLIGQPVAVYETEYGYALVTNSEKFKPPVTDSAQDGGVQMSIEEQTPVATEKNVAELTRSEKQDAAMGIRTPVAGVRVLHDWPATL